MDNWNQFLLQTDLSRPLGVAALRDGFVSAIGHPGASHDSGLGLIAISGDDAASFLHNQLTNDVEHLTGDTVRLAAYCTPKGRILASFLMWRNDTTVYLQLSRDIQAAIQKRLQMFVLRAKVKLADATEDGDKQVILGIGGANAGAALATWFDTLPAAPYSQRAHTMGTLIRVADAFGAPRYQWLMTAETALAVWPALSGALAGAGGDAWALSDIHAGVPRIAKATQEQFVPQMVNFELLGGVNFKKGCYPGQEIVARSQYLGKLKRRTTLVSIDGPASTAVAGSELFALADPGQPAGMVVNSAPNGDGGVDALVELKLSAIEEAQVRLGAADGPALRFLPMPYVLDALDL